MKLIGKFLDFLLSEKFEKCRLCLDPSRCVAFGQALLTAESMSLKLEFLVNIDLASHSSFLCFI